MENDSNSRLALWDEKAEQCILSAVMLDNDTMDEITYFRPEFFHAAHHKIIYMTMQRQWRERQQFDAVTLAGRLQDEKILEECGGVGYLAEIMNVLPHAAHIRHYAEIVHEMWMRRTIEYASRDAIGAAHDRSLEIDDVIEKAELVASTVAEDIAGAEMSIVKDVLLDVLDELERGVPPGIPTGFEDVDMILNGGQPGQLLVLAARTSIGKTAFAVNWMMNVAKEGKTVAVFSLEMEKSEIVGRMLQIECGLTRTEMHHPDEETNSRIMDAAHVIGELPVFIQDQPNSAVRDIAAGSRIIKRKHGLDMIFIDYLQLVEPETKKVNREQQIATTTRSLKQLSKSLGVPIVCLAQLNREPEKRDDKRPRMSDLRESGAIEQDADVIIFLHRPDATDPDDRPGEADIIIAKQRDGAKGTAHLMWDAPTTTFSKYDPVKVQANLYRDALDGFNSD